MSDILIFIIDDERPALETLHSAVREAIPAAEIKVFRRAVEALAAIEQRGDQPEIVFSDITMPGLDGLALAVRVKTALPQTHIVFVTGYSDYALKAFQVHAGGYLVKPVSSGQIAEELKYLNAKPTTFGNKLYIRCFGNFEVFWNEKPLSFKRRKSKELLGYLVDRKGALCSAEEIVSVLWEDESNLKNGKHKLRNLLSDLKAALSEIGEEHIMIRQRGGMAIDRNAVDCDYYRMLDGDIRAVNAFKGEYMTQYSWAELTTSQLYFNNFEEADS